jgi:hypothetical protein
MKKNVTLAIGLFIIIVVGLVVLVMLPSGANAPTTSTSTPSTPSGTVGIADLISVNSPLSGAEVASPISVVGMARGTWYFEASFPIEILDASGKSIAQSPAEAQSDWMTEDFVPFKATVAFPKQPAGSKGTIVLHKDNPSGEPERDRSISIPVTFK